MSERMDPEIKERWCAALESEQYQQGQDWLRKDDRFCCLGVLCDLYAKETGEPWMARDRMYAFMGASACLPERVIAWAGLTNYNPMIAGTAASCWNDNGTPFPAIAAAIREHL